MSPYVYPIHTDGNAGTCVELTVAALIFLAFRVVPHFVQEQDGASIDAQSTEKLHMLTIATVPRLTLRYDPKGRARETDKHRPGGKQREVVRRRGE